MCVCVHIYVSVCVCMYVCIPGIHGTVLLAAFMCVCVYIYIYIYIYIPLAFFEERMPVCTCVCVCACMHVCMYLCIVFSGLTANYVRKYIHGINILLWHACLAMVCMSCYGMHIL